MESSKLRSHSIVASLVDEDSEVVISIFPPGGGFLTKSSRNPDEFESGSHVSISRSPPLSHTFGSGVQRIETVFLWGTRVTISLVPLVASPVKLTQHRMTPRPREITRLQVVAGIRK